MSNPYPRCWKCNTQYHYQIPRPWVVKNLLFFLPVRKYFCPHCVTSRYSWGAPKNKSSDYTVNSNSEKSSSKK